MDLHRLVVDQCSLVCSAQISGEALDKRVLVVADHLIGRINSALHQASSRHRLIARRDLIDALRSVSFA